MECLTSEGKHHLFSWSKLIKFYQQIIPPKSEKKCLTGGNSCLANITINQHLVQTILEKKKKSLQNILFYFLAIFKYLISMHEESLISQWEKYE